MRIGFLGLGNMGTPMALRLIAAGHELSVWNRTEARTNPLIHEGAIVAGTPAEAELGADAVMTMLADDEAYEHVVFGPNGLADALSPGALHISCSTIGVAFSKRVASEYAKRGIDFVAAPVFGDPILAEEGRLWVAAAGAEEAVKRARPPLQAFSRGITVVGAEPSHAHAVKLGGSFLVSAMVYSLAEAFEFSGRHGVDAKTFFEAINKALIQSPLCAALAHSMLHPADQVGPTIELGARDLRTLREAAATQNVRMGFADQMAQKLTQALRSGTAGESWVAALYRAARGNREISTATDPRVVQLAARIHY